MANRKIWSSSYPPKHHDNDEDDNDYSVRCAAAAAAMLAATTFEPRGYLGLPNKDLYFTRFEQDVAVGEYVIGSASHHVGDNMLIGTDVPIENDEESPYIDNQNIGNTSCAPECDVGTSRRPRSQRKRRQNTQNEFVASAIRELADSIRSSSNKSARTEDKEDLMVTCMHVAQRLGITDMQKYQLMVYLKNPEFVPPFAKFDNDGSRWATIWAAIDSVPPPTPPPSLDP